MVDFKNVTENLVYIIPTNILTAFIVFTLCSSVNEKATINTINALVPTIDIAIAKHTTAITNAIEIKDNKFKKNDSLKILIDQKPENKQDNLFIETKTDTVIANKKSWFGRIFSKGN